MISTWAILASAEKQIPNTHSILIDAKAQLSLAIKCADNYTKTWHSIYWNSSNAGTKRKVRERLHDLAFDCFTHFMIAIDYLNQYAHIMDEQGIKCSRWWAEVQTSLSLGYSSITLENKHQIYFRQLRLVL